MADGEVDPAEMLRHGLAPRLAVVAGCGSAAAMDEEGWGSIAAALLDAGTAMVIATDRSVEDTTTLAVMNTFYAQPDWQADPARALARVQLAFDAAAVGASDGAAAPTWAAFSVLGRPPFIP
jgi:CHAT domain-containing protein